MGQSDTMDFLSPRGKKNQQAPLGNLLDEISPALTVWSHQMMYECHHFAYHHGPFLFT